MNPAITVVPIPPGRVAKLSQQGFAMIADLRVDGSLEEWRVGHGDDRWGGSWTDEGGRLRITVGEYDLVRSARSSRATETSQSWQPSAFHVLPLAARPEPADGGTWAAIKVYGDGRLFADILHPDGSLEEFDLRAGSQAGTWWGSWHLDGDALVLSVHGYEWRGHGDGEWTGWESSPDGGGWAFPVVTVMLDPASTAQAMGPDSRERLFEFGGYVFHAIDGDPKGYFGSVVEARRGDTHRFAAKLIGAQHRDVAVREAEISQLVSGVGGNISAFESFDLPHDENRFGRFAGYHVQVMEWGVGDLGGIIQRNGPMGAEQTLEVIAEVAGALAVMHKSAGLVHSDVKPGNIIAREAGADLHWRLADFNVATRIDPTTGEAPLRGTTDVCISPEMAVRRNLGARTVRPADDVWALGLVGIQCLTGELLEAGRSVDRDSARRLADPYPGIVVDIIRACLAPEGERSTAAQIRTRAQTALDGLG